MAQAPRTSTVSRVRHEPPISSAAAASGRKADRIPSPSQYIGNDLRDGLDPPPEVLDREEDPRDAEQHEDRQHAPRAHLLHAGHQRSDHRSRSASSRGARAATTQTTVSHPAAPWCITLVEEEERSGSGAPRTRGPGRASAFRTWPVTYPISPCGTALAPQQRAVLPFHRERVGGSDHQTERHHRAEDAGQRDRGEEQVGPSHLRVAVKKR